MSSNPETSRKAQGACLAFGLTGLPLPLIAATGLLRSAMMRSSNPSLCAVLPAQAVNQAASRVFNWCWKSLKRFANAVHFSGESIDLKNPGPKTGPDTVRTTRCVC